MRQNYPNPFSNQTTIQFVLSRPSNISLKIYDILGREVAILTDGKFDPGIFTTYCDGRNDTGQSLPNGIYFYRLQTTEKVETRKLILTR